MRPSAVLVAALSCLLVCSTLLGCGSSAACGQSLPILEPSRAAPGETFLLRGGGFGGGCDDSNLPFRPEPPQKNVLIEMRQGEKVWGLATVDAGGAPDYVVEAKLRVPKGAEPGRAVVFADAGVPRDDPGYNPLKIPFRVLDGGPPG